MAKNKTAETQKDVKDFILEFTDSEQKRQDSYDLVALLEEISGFKAKMWGPSIIGFGSYHYKYASGHEGDAPILGFSPRKAAISLYVSTGIDNQQALIEKLGKYKMGKACIYVKKLSDIDIEALKSLMKDTIDWVRSTYG